MHETWHWLLNFMGVNNGDNSFATHMYNFWSGFGGNVSILALVGTIIGVYRHNQKRLERLNPMHFVKSPITIPHKKDESEDNHPKA